MIKFSVEEEPTVYLIHQIDILQERPDDIYSVHLSQLFKFLLKKRVVLSDFELFNLIFTINLLIRSVLINKTISFWIFEDFSKIRVV